MKHKLTLPFLFLFSFLVYCQDDVFKVDYQFRQFGKDKPSVLYFNESSSLFIYDNTDEKSKIEQVTQSEFKIDSKNTDIEGRRYYLNKTNDKLISREFFFNDPYIIEEVIPRIKWELQDEMKKIGEYECKKAVGFFRGRTYTAWYSTEVPVVFGPWKLSGLPGLIFECKDDRGDIHFLISKIQKLPNTKKIIRAPDNGIETLTIAEYREKLESGEKEVEERLRSKIPRGVTVKIAKVSYNPMELEFEN